MKNIKYPTHAIIQNVSTFDKDEYLASGISERVFKQILALQRNRAPLKLTGVECEVDGTFQNDYHGVQLPDGGHLEAFSGHNLKPLYLANQLTLNI